MAEKVFFLYQENKKLKLNNFQINKNRYSNSENSSRGSPPIQVAGNKLPHCFLKSSATSELYRCADPMGSSQLMSFVCIIEIEKQHFDSDTCGELLIIQPEPDSQSLIIHIFDAEMISFLISALQSVSKNYLPPDSRDRLQIGSP